MTQNQMQAQTYPQKEVLHPWAFGEANSFKGSYTWPEFDLAEEAKTDLENDILLEKLHERLLVKSAGLNRED